MATVQFQYESIHHFTEHRCRIALLGFGTVGSSVARLLQNRGDSSLQLTHIYNRDFLRKKVSWIGSEVEWTDNFDDVLSSPVDVVVELIGGLDPAHHFVRRALQSGKSVVTANKQLMAHVGPELLNLADDNGVHLGYGASVAGGIPVLSALEEGLAGDSLVEIRGVLNGTCNYILSRMEQAGVSFLDALREAQQAGFAEADPTADVDGLDASAKLAILARAAFNVDVSPAQVACRSIRSISHVDFAYAHELGCTIRQISTARLEDARLHLSVGPALVAESSNLAKVSGSENLVITTGNFGGETRFGGHGAGGDPTAVAVVSDVLQAARPRQLRAPGAPRRGLSPYKAMENVVGPHYLRLIVRDRPGILAEVAGALARHSINVDAVLQTPNHPKSALPFVITLEPCPQTAMQAAANEIAERDFLLQAPLVVPVLK